MKQGLVSKASRGQSSLVFISNTIYSPWKTFCIHSLYTALFTSTRLSIYSSTRNTIKVDSNVPGTDEYWNYILSYTTFKVQPFYINTFAPTFMELLKTLLEPFHRKFLQVSHAFQIMSSESIKRCPFNTVIYPIHPYKKGNEIMWITVQIIFTRLYQRHTHMM